MLEAQKNEKPKLIGLAFIAFEIGKLLIGNPGESPTVDLHIQTLHQKLQDEGFLIETGIVAGYKKEGKR